MIVESLMISLALLACIGSGVSMVCGLGVIWFAAGELSDHGFFEAAKVLLLGVVFFVGGVHVFRVVLDFAGSYV